MDFWYEVDDIIGLGYISKELIPSLQEITGSNLSFETFVEIKLKFSSIQMRSKSKMSGVLEEAEEEESVVVEVEEERYAMSIQFEESTSGKLWLSKFK